jgi:NADPH:quinone reductase-like Zn-dependent oxidoreductase
MVIVTLTITTKAEVMSQLTLTGVGSLADNVSLDDAPSPEPGTGQAVVALEAANINPADSLYAMGWYGIAPVVGRAVGNEGVGRVIATGPGVDSTWIGQRVIFLVNGKQGVWADAVLAQVESLIRVGDAGDPLQIAQLGVNPVTAQVLLSRFGADLKPGDWVGQSLGNSAVGQYVSQLARLAGYRTLSVVRSERAAEQVVADGGDLAVLSGEGLGSRIAEVLGGQKLGLVLDGEGGETAGALAASLVDGGTVAAYSSASGASQTIGIADLIYRNVRLEGWWIVNWLTETPRSEVEAVYAKLAALIESGDLRSAVDSTFPLSSWREALARTAESGRSGKVLFTF